MSDSETDSETDNKHTIALDATAVADMHDEKGGESDDVWAISKLVVKSPYLALGAASFMVFTMVFIVVICGHHKMAEPTAYDWTISSYDASLRQDALDGAVRDVDSISAGGEHTHSEDMRHRSISSGRNNIAFMYMSKDNKNIFTAPNLKHMCLVENVFLEDARYKELCILDEDDWKNGTCATPHASVVTSFYGTNRDCRLLPATHVDSVAARLLNPAFRSRTGIFLGREVKTLGYTSITRSIFNLGGPAKGFTEMPSGRSVQQNTVYRPFWETLENNLWARFGVADKGAPYRETMFEGPLEVYWWGSDLQSMEFNRTISKDLLWALGSIVFVLGAMFFHIGSLFLTLTGMVQILMSLPCALFFYRTLGGVGWISQLHVLCIYLVLGIGADDLFVFYDAWRQSAQEPAAISGTELTRLDYAYKRAAGAMLTTSSTTAIAFFATATSPIMPISGFGIFAACAVIVNYILVMTIFPPLVLIYHRTNICGIPGKDTDEDEGKPDVADSDGDGSKYDEEDEHVYATADMSTLQRFFVEYYSPFMTGPYRFIPIAVYFIYFVQAAYFALQMEPPTEQEQWFTEDHMVTKAMSLMGTQYMGGDEKNYVNVDLVWGLHGMDRSATSRWTPYDRGLVVFDDSFDVQGAGAYAFFAETCRQLVAEPCTATGCMDGTNKMTRELTCFADDWRAWYDRQQCHACTDDADGALAKGPGGSSCATLVAGAKATNCPLDLSTLGLGSVPYTLAQMCPVTCGSCNKTAACTPTAEAALPTGASFVSSLHDFRIDPANNVKYKNRIGFIEKKLKFLVVTVKSTLLRGQPNPVTQPVYDKFEDFLGRINAAAPAGLNKGFHAGGRQWTWNFTEGALVANVFQGFMICFPAAFIVLLIATHNIILSAIAIFTIAGIVGCVLGMCKAYLGWGLGVAESIAAVIVIGFSVDFTVHLAHTYVESEATTRSGRMADAARMMGETVTFGAITTMGAGCFLWMCQLTFFTKFAALVVGTIVFSITAALLFFMPVIATIGPEGDQGDVLVWFRAMTNKDGQNAVADADDDNVVEVVATAETSNPLAANSDS